MIKKYIAVFALLGITCFTLWAKDPFADLSGDISSQSEQSREDKYTLFFTNTRWKLDSEQTINKKSTGFIRNVYCLTPVQDPEYPCTSKIVIDWINKYEWKGSYGDLTSRRESDEKAWQETLDKKGNRSTEYYMPITRNINGRFKLFSWRSSPEYAKNCQKCFKYFEVRRTFDYGEVYFTYAEPKSQFDKRQESFFEGLIGDVAFFSIPRPVL